MKRSLIAGLALCEILHKMFLATLLQTEIKI